MPESAPASAPGQVRGKKRVRVWPMGTMPNETRGVPYEESVISAGEIFLGASGVIYSIFLYGDLLKDLGPCGKCPSWLGGLERPSTPRGV